MFGVMPPFREITTGQKRSPLAVLTRLVILTTRFIGDPPYLGLLYHLLYHSPYDIKNKRTGGESGIRTHVTLSSKHAFQACAFSHSAISPAFRQLRGTAPKLITRLGEARYESFRNFHSGTPLPKKCIIFHGFLVHARLQMAAFGIAHARAIERCRDADA